MFKVGHLINVVKVAARYYFSRGSYTLVEMRLTTRIIAVFVCVCVAMYGIPFKTWAEPSMPRGEKSADAAAGKLGVKKGTDSLQDTASFLRLGYAQPDTTTFEFPEEEEEHLVRDITVFVIASAFVAYFIVKVFIEEEEEVVDDGPPGKKIPTR